MFGGAEHVFSLASLCYLTFRYTLNKFTENELRYMYNKSQCFLLGFLMYVGPVATASMYLRFTGGSFETYIPLVLNVIAALSLTYFVCWITLLNRYLDLVNADTPMPKVQPPIQSKSKDEVVLESAKAKVIDVNSRRGLSQ
jgi:hypothetical protein